MDYLHKPVNPIILRSKVAVFAELHRKNLDSVEASRALLAEVTQRRRAEEELRELNENLEQRVTERTEALSDSEGRYRLMAERCAGKGSRRRRESREGSVSGRSKPRVAHSAHTGSHDGFHVGTPEGTIPTGISSRTWR